jgi:hypothetical protein
MNPMTDRWHKVTKQLKRWCADDWEAKIVALVLAVLVWWGVKTLIASDVRERNRVPVPSGFEPPGAKKEVTAP